MSDVSVKRAETGFSLLGDVRFHNVLDIRKKGNCLIDRIDIVDLTVDLSGVTSGDTSTLSLLLRWLFYASQQNKRIHYISIPESLLHVAEVCGLTQLINGTRNG